VLGLDEFGRLHQFLILCQTSFYTYDRDRSGKLTLDELAQALAQAGGCVARGLRWSLPAACPSFPSAAPAPALARSPLIPSSPACPRFHHPSHHHHLARTTPHPPPTTTTPHPHRAQASIWTGPR
jgi:hypothetical protein